MTADPTEGQEFPEPETTGVTDAQVVAPEPKVPQLLPGSIQELELSETLRELGTSGIRGTSGTMLLYVVQRQQEVTIRELRAELADTRKEATRFRDLWHAGDVRNVRLTERLRIRGLATVLTTLGGAVLGVTVPELFRGGGVGFALAGLLGLTLIVAPAIFLRKPRD